MDARRCSACRNGDDLDFDIVMAFQPIVDVASASVWGYEALVRGTAGEGAGTILGRVNDENRYKFDQRCRVKAIETAGRLFSDKALRLSINFMPNAVYEPAACIRTTLAAAARVGFAHDRIMFEFTENEKMADVAKVTHIVNEYKRFGFVTALDDFGAGHAGLNLLAAFQPQIIKLDMDLVRDIHLHRPRQIIVAGIIVMARELGVEVLAEGIESRAEMLTLRSAGLRLMQGYHFARPAIEALPDIAADRWPASLRQAA